MGSEFTMNVAATSNSSANTDDVFLLIKAAAGLTILLKRIRVSFPATTPADWEALVKVQRASGTGAGTTLVGTALKRRQSGPASGSSFGTKSTTNSFATGTVVDTPISSAVNTRSVFEWIARDEYDYIESPIAASYIAIVVQVSTASYLVNCECDWEE
jgi:hypothetical protein